MAAIESNLSAFRLVENVKDDVERGRSELIELGKKNMLSFGNIDTYTDVVEKGLKNLAVEVCGLEAKLRIITKERDELLDTINNLRVEITQLSTQLGPTFQPIPLQEATPNGEPKYKCELCLYVTTQRHHMIVHSNELHRSKIQTNYVPDKEDIGSIDEVEELKGNSTQFEQGQTKIPPNDQSDLMAVTKKKVQDRFSFLEEKFYELKEVKAKDGNKSIIVKFQCIICGKDKHCSTASYSNLRRHIDMMHSSLIKEYDILCANNKLRGKKRIQLDRKSEERSMTQADPNDCPKQNISEKDSFFQLDYACEKCPFSTSQKQQLLTHEVEAHAEGSSSEDSKPPIKYQCKECEYKASQKSSLRRHVETAHKTSEKRWNCDQCPFMTTYKQNLRSHVANVHKMRKRLKRKLLHNRRILWSQVMKTRVVSAKKSSDTRHRVDNGRKYGAMHFCEKCDYKTARRAHLKGHIKFEHEGKVNMFACEHCDYMTEQKGHWQRHVKKVHGGQTLKIDKIETLNANSVVSELTNVAVQPSPSEEEQVANVHNKMRKRLKRTKVVSPKKSSDTRHRVDNGRKYGAIHFCEKCDYKTPRRAHLKGHIKFEHEGKVNMFACEHCDYMTEQKGHWQRHVKKVHGGQSLKIDEVETLNANSGDSDVDVQPSPSEEEQAKTQPTSQMAEF